MVNENSLLAAALDPNRWRQDLSSLRIKVIAVRKKSSPDGHDKVLPAFVDESGFIYEHGNALELIGRLTEFYSSTTNEQLETFNDAIYDSETKRDLLRMALQDEIFSDLH